MSIAATVAFVLYLLAALVSFLLGMLYLTRSSIMPWHEVAVGIPWAQIDSRMQALLLSQLRVAGAGFTAAALSIAFLLFIPFRAGESWALFAIPAVGLCIAVPTLMVLLHMRKRTGARPLLAFSGGVVVLIVAGFISSWF